MEIIQLMLHLLVTSQERECINLKIGYNGWVEIGGGGGGHQAENPDILLQTF